MQKTHVHLSHLNPAMFQRRRMPQTRMAALFVHFRHTYIYLFRNTYIYRSVNFYVLFFFCPCVTLRSC